MDAPNPTRSDATTTPATADDDAAVDYSNLPPDIVADIHARLTHLDRLTVAAVFGAAGHSMNPEAPWLAIPGGETTTTAPAPPTKLYSISDRRAAAARAGEAAMRGCFFLGGSGDGGWLVIADKRSRLRMVNPVTGAHRALPAITTCPFFNTTSWAGRGSHVNLTAGPFMRVRHGGGPPPRPPEQLIGTSLYTVTAGQVRQYVYRKVVLSAAARPGSYAAMLVLAPARRADVATSATRRGAGGDLAGGCIYFTDDDVARGRPFDKSKDDDHWRYREDDREIVAGVYSLEKHRAHKLPVLQRRRRTPSYGHDHDDDDDINDGDDNYDGNADADDNGGGGDDDGEDEEEVQIGKIWPPPVWFKPCTSAASTSS
uniref:KIB1-4 beta-propeller domain-containing protein n=1 Tax=Oryza barthii TaxID=65489 RepID=A0A0D3FSF4_9ORYZ